MLSRLIFDSVDAARMLMAAGHVHLDMGETSEAARLSSFAATSLAAHLGVSHSLSKLAAASARGALDTQKQQGQLCGAEEEVLVKCREDDADCLLGRPRKRQNVAPSPE